MDKLPNEGYYRVMNEQISLIPYPLSLKQEKGTFKTPKTFELLLSKVEYSKAKEYNGFSLENKEAYALVISTKKILVLSSAKQGKFYAEQTLKQLFLSYKEEIPCLTICDKPEYEWRGFLLDTSRSFYSVTFIKKMLDIMALHKFNVFHWHLTDDQGWRFEVPEYPKLVKVGSVRMDNTLPEEKYGVYDDRDPGKMFYTEKDIKDVINYAAKRCITIIPEVEFPGHVSALLASYPELGCTGGPYKVENRWGIFPDVLCLGNDKIFKLYDAAIGTLARLFPGPYIHIGGDECPHERWETCPKCKKRMKENHLSKSSELQSWGTSQIVKLVLKHNKIPIGWDEVLDNTDKIPVPAELTIQSWRGEEGGNRSVGLNHKVIMSPVTHVYLNLKNKKDVEEPGRLGSITCQKAYSFSPFTKKMKKAQRPLVMGGECCLWTEALPYSKSTEYLLFPRMCAVSESLWLPLEKKDFERFENCLDVHKKRLHDLNFGYYDGGLK